MIDQLTHFLKDIVLGHTHVTIFVILLIATLLWLIASLGFKFYTANFGAYNEAYGTVGGIIVLAIGLNLLKVKQTKTIDMLPALILIVLYGLWVG